MLSPITSAPARFDRPVTTEPAATGSVVVRTADPPDLAYDTFTATTPPPPPVPPTPTPDAPPLPVETRLADAVQTVLARDPNMRAAHWGLSIADDKGKVLYQSAADRLFNPASCLKLVTASAATAVLGPDKRFETRLATSGRVDADGVLRGDLVLVGGGDPSLATADLEAAVTRLGVRRVEGRIVVDDRVFDDERLGAGWSWDNTSAAFSAEVDGLNLDKNTAVVNVSRSGVTASPDAGYLTFENHATAAAQTQLDVERKLGTNVITVDGTVADAASTVVTVHDPALYAGAVLKSLCHRHGIEVSGEVTRGAVDGAARTLWSRSSAPLRELERQMLKHSDNLYAETLFRALADGQSAKAPAREAQVLHLDGPWQIVDGSGLSHKDLLTPDTLRKTVEQGFRDPANHDLLPIAGVDGTLARRMPALKGRVHAKTGTLANVSTLAGWLTLKDGRRFSFAWMCNDYAGSGVKATEDVLMTAVDAALSQG